MVLPKDILDLTLRTAAITTFDGVSVGANARSYADALMYPHIQRVPRYIVKQQKNKRCKTVCSIQK